MSADSFDKLENKIDMLIATVASLREEKNRLSEEVDLQKKKLHELESGNQAFGDEFESLKKSNEDKQKKLDSAAEKVQSLLTKLESVA